MYLAAFCRANTPFYELEIIDGAGKAYIDLPGWW